MNSDTRTARRMVRPWRRWAAVGTLAILVTAATGPTWAQDSVAELEARRAEIAEQAAATAAEIDLLVAEDAELAAAVDDLEGWIAAVQADIDAAEQAIEVAEEQSRIAAAEAARLDADIVLLEEVLAERAVEAYVRPGGATTEAVLEADDMNAAARRRFLIGLTQEDINSVLDGIRVARSDRDEQLEVAEIARQTAAEERQALDARLLELEEAKAAHEGLRAELERRIAEYREQTAQLRAADDHLSELIRDAQAPPPVVAPVPVESEPEPEPTAALDPDPTPEPTAELEPTAEPEPSGGGSGSLQWPISGPVVSTFGMRVHPIFGDSRMHAGIDVDGDTGDPIAAAAAGTVIFAGWQDGYGNVVIVDHGGSLSTVYAHMSTIGASEGAAVGAGEVVGQVGSTGYSTGPHLHFEVREDGNAVDPLQYLP